MTPAPHAHTADFPSNLYKPAAPLLARIVEHRRLTHPDSPNEVRHITFDIADSRFRYLDGQSLGVLPPGVDADGRPYKLRLYSIASPHQGDDGAGRTVSICVKRALNPPHPPGVCSNYLCDLAVGDTVNLTGPVGKSFLLPDTPNTHMILIATGTGIAPFRAFLKTRYGERAAETGQTWLFFGVKTRLDYLYGDEIAQYERIAGFHPVTAFSREEQNARGGRMYVQDRLQEHAESVFSLLQEPHAALYMCGLRGMEPAITEGLRLAAASQGIDYEAFMKRLTQENRWHVEVY